MWRRLFAQLRTLAPKSNQFVSDTVLSSSPPPFAFSSPASLCFRHFSSETVNAAANMKRDLGIILGSRLLLTSVYNVFKPCLSRHATTVQIPARRFITTGGTSAGTVSQDASSSLVTPRIKFKRLDKTAQHIMQILDKEAVKEVRVQREIPDIKPGYIIQLKVEVPENKRRVSIVKGIVIARRNAGLNTTFRLRRLVAGVGVENLFHLYSPNLKEIKVLDKKKVRRAKLYYLRDKMNALKKH